MNILNPFFFIGENIVSFINIFKLFFSRFIPLINIRMILAR